MDVVRTDRALVFYENEANQAKLWDILAIYTWVDDDIGYVQGDKLYSCCYKFRTIGQQAFSVI